jgi:hypothetical protein
MGPARAEAERARTAKATEAKDGILIISSGRVWRVLKRAESGRADFVKERGCQKSVSVRDWW